jgi:hypothetical protein
VAQYGISSVISIADDELIENEGIFTIKTKSIPKK